MQSEDRAHQQILFVWGQETVRARSKTSLCLGSESFDQRLVVGANVLSRLGRLGVVAKHPGVEVGDETDNFPDLGSSLVSRDGLPFWEAA